MRAIRPVSLGLLIVLVAVIACGVVAARRGGFRLYIVHTGSMTPALNPGDVVVDRPASTLRRGEIVTFQHSFATTDVVTHRITRVEHGLIHTKGDANRTADVWEIRPSQVRGSVVHRIPYLGYVLVFLKQPAGVCAVMAFALTVMLLWGLFFPAGQPSRPGPHAMADQRVLV